MPNQTVSPLTDHSWIPSSAWRRLGLSEQKKIPTKNTDLLDDLPVMQKTVLALEMLLHEPCIDLRMASELVLSDLGATLHVLRLVGREYEFADQPPARMGDCLAILDAETWFEAISARTFASGQENSAANALWSHSRLVAQYAQLVTESLEGTSPTNAYLVGLLHEIGSIPEVLGRSESTSLSSIEESLPLFVIGAIRNSHDPHLSSTWKFILSEAHELAGARTDFDRTTLTKIAPRSGGATLLRTQATCCLLPPRINPTLT
jgi:hypothetical protein